MLLFQNTAYQELSFTSLLVKVVYRVFRNHHGDHQTYNKFTYTYVAYCYIPICISVLFAKCNVNIVIQPRTAIMCTQGTLHCKGYHTIHILDVFQMPSVSKTTYYRRPSGCLKINLHVSRKEVIIIKVYFII